MIARIFSFVISRWALIAAASAAAMLAAAHAFERFGGLAPCALCLRQREAYWAAIAIAAVAIAAALAVKQPWIRRLGAAALGVAFAYGLAMALWHVGVEHKWLTGPAECAAGGASGPISVDDITAALGTPQKIIRCEDVAWSFLGVSMAGWNALVSLKLLIYSAIAAVWSPKAHA